MTVPLTYSLTPRSPPGTDSEEPAPPEESPTADDLLEHARRSKNLHLQSSKFAAFEQSVVGECWPARNKLIKHEEPSLIRSSVKPCEATERRSLLADLRWS